MSRTLQLCCLAALTLLAVGVLLLIGWAFFIVGSHIDAQGRVPAAEAFGLSALLLSFREVVGGIRGVLETEVRANLTDKLGASTPVAPPATDAPITTGAAG